MSGLLRVALGLLGLLLAGCASEAARPPIGTFNLSFRQLDAEAQVALVEKVGYDGLMVGTWEDRAPWPKLRSYAKLAAVRAGTVRIMAILANLEVAKPATDRELAELAEVSAELRAPLWVYVHGGRRESAPIAVDMLRRLADACQAKGGSLVLYPHEGCVYADLEESVALLGALDRPGVTTSFHLCHELKAGNIARFDGLIRTHAPRISLVSLNGADSRRYAQPGWDGAILPLDQGDIDVAPILRSLRAAGYAGPVLIHTFGLQSPPEEHLRGSLRRWRQIVDQVYPPGNP
jgi:sugar phosphate isomerase/epimerase